MTAEGLGTSSGDRVTFLMTMSTTRSEDAPDIRLAEQYKGNTP
jgi:hypothetical protein